MRPIILVRAGAEKAGQPQRTTRPQARGADALAGRDTRRPSAVSSLPISENRWRSWKTRDGRFSGIRLISSVRSGEPRTAANVSSSAYSADEIGRAHV